MLTYQCFPLLKVRCGIFPICIKTALKLAVNIGYIVKLGVDSQLLRLHRYACQDAGICIVLERNGVQLLWTIFRVRTSSSPWRKTEKEKCGRRWSGRLPWDCVGGGGNFVQSLRGNYLYCGFGEAGGLWPKIKKIYYKRTGFFFT